MPHQLYTPRRRRMSKINGTVTVCMRCNLLIIYRFKSGTHTHTHTALRRKYTHLRLSGRAATENRVEIYRFIYRTNNHHNRPIHTLAHRRISIHTHTHSQTPASIRTFDIHTNHSIYPYIQVQFVPNCYASEHNRNTTKTTLLADKHRFSLAFVCDGCLTA